MKLLTQFLNLSQIRSGAAEFLPPPTHPSIGTGIWPTGYRNRCNFDVEIHDEIMEDIQDLDIVYIVSGDSDFIRTKEKVLKRQKHIKFIAYENNCAWEIRTASWFISLDSIRAEVERVKNPQN